MNDQAKRNQKRGCLIVLAVVATLGLLGVGTVVAGVLWLRANGPELARGIEASGKDAAHEAQAWAEEGHDQADCLDEAFARIEPCGNLALQCRLRATLFLGFCARAATPSPGFCDYLPRSNDLVGTTKHSLAVCAQRGLAQNQGCPPLVQAHVGVCEAMAKADAGP